MAKFAIFWEFRNLKKLIMEFYFINDVPFYASDVSVTVDIICRRKSFQKLFQNRSWIY